MSLYLPAAFCGDVSAAAGIVAAQPFATLITPTAAEPWISHLPVLADPAEPEWLYGHLARGNGHCQALFQRDSVLLFHGEHGYVSPTMYVSGGVQVPTWNYRVAHAHGRAEVLDDASLLSLLARMTQQFEGDAGWQLSAQPPAAIRAMLAAICGFRLRVARWEVKEKLSQNRAEPDRLAVRQALAEGDAASRQLAGQMAGPVVS